MFLKGPILTTILIIFVNTLCSQTIPVRESNDITSMLVAKGYENVRVTWKNDTLWIGVENRVWRWQSRGAAEVIKLVMPVVDSNGVVALTLLRTGIPFATVFVSRKQYEHLLNGTMTPSGFSDSVVAILSDRAYKVSSGHERNKNRSFNKFDVVVAPQLKVQFGNYLHPLEIQFNVAPYFQISFLKGMSFTGQLIIPVFNNIIGMEEENTIRPGLVVLSQTFRLPHQFFATVNAGYFTRDRYGMNGEVRKYLFNGKLGFGANLGYTGRMQLVEGIFTYTPMETFTWFCDASWRFSRYDLTIRAGYGGFIDRDQGWRIDIKRQFGEVSIGFFAMQTGGITNGGFNFVVPLPPRKYGTRNRIRLRPASYVPWEYRAKGLPSYGRTFSTSTLPDDFLFDLNPDLIRTQLGKQLINH